MITLGLGDMAVALSLVAIAILASLRLGLRMERTLLWATCRTVVQLLAVGYVVHALFALDHPLPVLGILLVMLVAASWTAAGRPRMRRGALVARTFTGLLLGGGLTIVIVVHVVVGADPWYAPRYLIPLGGMILGNAMNGAALGLERFERELVRGRPQVEAILALGGTPVQAAAEAEREAVRASLVPTVNSMLVVGLVQLPGIMTGQILAGADPLVAVRYQMLVMFMLLSAVSLASGISVRLSRRLYFTEAWQLRLP